MRAAVESWCMASRGPPPEPSLHTIARLLRRPSFSRGRNYHTTYLFSPPRSRRTSTPHPRRVRSVCPCARVFYARVRVCPRLPVSVDPSPVCVPAPPLSFYIGFRFGS
jgi:hypothetical protein